MGRYDKIRVWNGSSWIQPNHMKIRALLKKIRYIYIYQNGSTANTGNHLCQVEAYTRDGTNVAVGKTVTCGGAQSGLTCLNPGNCVKASLDSTYAETGYNGTWYGGARTWFIVDLGQGYDLDYIKVWRYYPDGRTYYETAICVVDVNGVETRLHEYTQEPLYAESSSGYVGQWIDLGANDSTNTRPFHVWNGSSWVRKTLNKTITYGDKDWYCNKSGANGTFNVSSRANVNQNAFNFYFYAAKDANGDRQVAYFGNGDIGWTLNWLADGRMMWQTRWAGTGYNSYSSNYISAGNFAVVNAYGSSGTGNGTLNFGGTTTSINRSGRHQWNGQTLTLGTWGVSFRGTMRCYGIDGSGNSGDYYSYVNNAKVMEGTQTFDYTTINNGKVTQDTSVSWT